MIFQVEGEESRKLTVKPQGNGAMAQLPKSWIGREVEVILLQEFDEIEMGEIEMKNNEKIQEYIDTFETDSIRACFLLGILTNKIVSYEFENECTNNFFMRELNKNWLDLERIRKIYNKSVAEVDKYELNFDNLVENISMNLMSSTNNWNLDKYDANYYYTLGHTLGGLYNE